jgi:hypothetical protein
MFVHSRVSLFASRTRRDLIHIERIVYSEAWVSGLSLVFFSSSSFTESARHFCSFFFGCFFCALIWGLPSPSCLRTRSDPHREWSWSWVATIASCQFCHRHSPFLKFNQQVDILLLAFDLEIEVIVAISSDPLAIQALEKSSSAVSSKSLHSFFTLNWQSRDLCFCIRYVYTTEQGFGGKLLTPVQSWRN